MPRVPHSSLEFMEGFTFPGAKLAEMLLTVSASSHHRIDSCLVLSSGVKWHWIAFSDATGLCESFTLASLLWHHKDRKVKSVTMSVTMVYVFAFK